jgi:hypothetical protein
MFDDALLTLRTKEGCDLRSWSFSKLVCVETQQAPQTQRSFKA